jgi:predicted amidophosphoribosyltransferase
MANPKIADINVECPCCGARLVIDPTLRKVIAHEAPPNKHANAPDLDHAALLLREQAEKREAIFRKSTEDEKSKSQLLERKFSEALKKSKDEPITRPMRDIDLE